MRTVWLLLDSRGMGGIESHVAELAAGLVAAGDLPLVLFLADHGPHPLHARLQSAGVAWEVLSGGFGGLRRRLAERRPGVLHTHGYKANIVGRMAARLAGIPAIATYHAGERPQGKLALYDFIDRYTSCLGGRIAVSPPILRRLPYGGTLIPNFVAVPPAAPPPGPSVVAFVGRMVAEKGPDIFCALAARFPHDTFVAYGDGPMRATVAAQAGGRVHFQGAIAGMDGAWKDIGLLAITSRAEGLPLAALEAMAHGVPVAAFALGGLPDLITTDRNGYLAPPGDTDALAGGVARWLALPPAERATMSQAAWQTVQARFGREAGVEKVRLLYSILGG